MKLRNVRHVTLASAPLAYYLIGILANYIPHAILLLLLLSRRDITYG